MPTAFRVPGLEPVRSRYPFNVNPFSVRPCEKALNSKPEVVNDSLHHPYLVGAIAAICGWTGNYRSQQNRKFTELHPGVSVLGYQGAPHGPVVRLFRERLSGYLAGRDVTVSYSPIEARQPRPGVVYVLESHPAVSMAIWAGNQQLDGLDLVRKYKGNKREETRENFGNLRESVGKLVAERFNMEDVPIGNHDDLDAFVSLLNVVDLLRGHGDWIGTVEHGHFLTPRVEGLDRPMADLWQEAAATYA